MGMRVVEFDTIKFLAFRFTTGFIVLSLLLIFGFQMVNYKGKPFFLILLCGALNPLTSQIFETSATTHAPTSQIAVFHSLSPIFIIILSIFINSEYPTKRQVFFMLVSILGLLFINLVGGQMYGSTTLGLILVLGMCLAISVHRVVVRRTTGSFTAFEIIYVTTGMGALGFSSTTLLTYATQGQLNTFFYGLWTFDFIVSILYMGIISCVIAHLCLTYANAHLPPAVFISTGKAASIISILVGIFILGEVLRPVDIVGMIITLLGAIGMSLSYNASASNRFRTKEKET